eukprot:Gregarina_sp_Pseudo_9__344@NODE_1221_length_1769_cov_35_491329_g1147_i0_p1_GENE_NODE_1221_length_1769_cov_35_491329_g1147_i0NODE_1221_length_1769_cov_35_491329_g1147_i0_p1_ORF_typecomplete_len540_score87_87Sugar_tr/PF00083_24/1_2e54MFS_1/PF07690_16/6_6e27MFS_1/PF07690_16/2_6e10TRI12/PF06609_13/2e12TRI12/PF06609_13/0_074MFS_3/PF05977_13/3_9e14MFS_3/PF05977_13/6_8MFS_3/PF05977_13/5_1e02MFS_4/PF06779_14/1_2e09MFS_4/PF06779_14/17MFS_4/PF06779_14/1_7e04MFS_1_like/PF12832_7/0_00013MFS_1_like/PF12832_7
MAESSHALIIRSDIPARLDRLAWSAWHTKLTVLLGLGWVLDALETTYNAMTLRTLGEVFEVSDLALTYINFMWMMGALAGAFTFGALSDRFGRRWVFLATIASYTVCTLCNSIFPYFWVMMMLRFLSGFGIGGENAAVHTVIQEFIPAKHRGKVGVLISASWDVAATGTSFLAAMCTTRIAPNWSWRVGMLIGGVLGMACFLLRLTIPDSPRWLLSCNRVEEAERITRYVETKCGGDGAVFVPPSDDLLIVTRLKPTPPLKALHMLFTKYRLQMIYSAGLNAVLNFDSYGFPGVSQLSIFPECGISESATSWVYVAATGVDALSNPLFAYLLDRVGRKMLIPALYICTFVCATGFFPAGHTCQYGALMAVTICWKFFEAPAANCAIAAGTEVFPIPLMSMGCGISHGVGRLFAAVSQTILVAVYNSRGGGNVSGTVGLVLGFYGIALTICSVWYFKGVEGAAQQLEGMSPPSKELDPEIATAEDDTERQLTLKRKEVPSMISAHLADCELDSVSVAEVVYDEHFENCVSESSSFPVVSV